MRFRRRSGLALRRPWRWASRVVGWCRSSVERGQVEAGDALSGKDASQDRGPKRDHAHGKNRDRYLTPVDRDPGDRVLVSLQRPYHVVWWSGPPSVKRQASGRWVYRHLRSCVSGPRNWHDDSALWPRLMRLGRKVRDDAPQEVPRLLPPPQFLERVEGVPPSRLEDPPLPTFAHMPFRNVRILGPRKRTAMGRFLPRTNL